MEKKMTKKQALKKYLNCKMADIEQVGESTFKAEGAEFMVLTDAEADKEAAEYIKDSLWAFNADFIIGECGLDFSGVDSLKAMQEKSCESANDFILSLVEKTCGLESFVESAISADGRGHLIGFYDGEEGEEGEYFIYRTN
jgi:hypothetical protein